MKLLSFSAWIGLCRIAVPGITGLTLVFGMMNVLNFAHAAFYMIGAYPAYSIMQYSSSFLLAPILSTLVLLAVGSIVEKFFLRRIHFEADESNSVFRYLFKSSLFKLND